MRRGVELEAHEAAALAQELTVPGRTNVELSPPLGPPTVENVELGRDGSVICRGCDATPAVSEIGRLLDAMLPRGASTRIPGALRYLIARATNEVDAPPFDSLAALSEALARHERGDRRDALRALAARVPAPASVPAPAAAAPRPAPVRLFEPRTIPQRQARFPWIAIGAAAASISFAASYVLVSHHYIQQQRNPAVASPAAAAQPLDAQAPTVLPRATSGSSDRPAPSEPATPESATPEPTTPERSTPERSTRPPNRPAVVPAAARPAGPMFSPAFASNGTALFYHTGGSSDARSALATSPLGGDLEVMTILDDGAKNYHVQPSPDGTRIAFDSDRDGARGVYLANRDGTGVRRVSGDGYAAVPTWSPDGREIAFVRAETDRPRVWNLWLQTLGTGATRRLTNFRFGQTWGASWFRDGDRVAYTHESRLVVLNLRDGSTRAYDSPVQGRLVRTPAVSPDGRHIIFQVSRSGAWLVDLSDGSMRCVLTDPTAEEFAWSPDGRRVAFHSRRDGHWGIWMMAPGPP